MVGIDDLVRYANLIGRPDVRTLDDASKELSLGIDECRKLHDIIYDVARRVTDTQTYKSRESLETQLALIDSMIQEVDVAELKYQDRKSILDALSTASKLRIELENLTKIKDQSSMLTAILKILFDELSSIDPMLAIKIRDSCVDKFDSLVMVLPAIPGNAA